MIKEGGCPLLFLCNLMTISFEEYMIRKSIYDALDFNDIRKILQEKAPSMLSKKMAENIVPETDYLKVEKLLNETENACICITEETSTPIGETHNISFILEKAKKRICLIPEECIDVLSSIETYNKMYNYFIGERNLKYPYLQVISNEIVPLNELVEDMKKVFTESGEINKKASSKLAQIYKEKEIIKNRIRREFQRILQDSKYETFFQDRIITQRNGRYVIPVKESFKYKFDGIVHDSSSTGQTLFMEPLFSVHLNNDLTELEVAEKKEIKLILESVTNSIRESADIIKNNCDKATLLEFIFARGNLALSMKAKRAALSDGTEIKLINAKHPLISKDKVVPISFEIGKNYKIMIITGANAGGKTIAMKTAGLFCMMNQCGLFIPADEGSVLPVFKNIYAIIGDEQSIQNNLSTFSAYITQLSSFLHKASKEDLILLDELGSGTDPVEGAALAQSVTEYLSDKGIVSIITSHFSEMKKLAYEKEGILNAFVEFDEKTLMPTYNLILGVAGNSNAFNICKRFGIPEFILERALELKEKSSLYNVEKIMERLNGEIRSVEKERKDLKNSIDEADKLKLNLQNEVENFYKKKVDILEKARVEAENMKRSVRVEAENIIKDLKKKAAKIEKETVNKDVTSIRNRIDGINIPNSLNFRDSLELKDIKKGDNVYIDTLNQDGVVNSISGKKITVICGNITVTVDFRHCFRSHNIKTEKKVINKIYNPIKSEFSVQSVSTNINVIGKTVDEAVPLVDKFLNQCFMAGVSPVQIIHGKGTGSLRRGIHEHLKTLNFIKEFHLADARFGGAGVTEVYF